MTKEDFQLNFQTDDRNNRGNHPALKLEIDQLKNEDSKSIKTPQNPTDGKAPSSTLSQSNNRLKQNSIYSILERHKKREAITSPASQQNKDKNTNEYTPNGSYNPKNFSDLSQ